MEEERIISLVGREEDLLIEVLDEMHRHIRFQVSGKDIKIVNGNLEFTATHGKLISIPTWAIETIFIIKEVIE